MRSRIRVLILLFSMVCCWLIPVVSASAQMNFDWIWSDPNTDSNYTNDSGSITINAPNGNDLWPDLNYDAPTYTKTISGDFDLTARVIANPATFYNGAGLVVRTSPNSFIRLERSYYSAQIITMNAVQNGIILGTNTVDYSGQDLYLRIVRKGDTFSGYYKGYHEAAWQQLWETTVDFPDQVNAGISVINQHNGYVFSANFLELSLQEVTNDIKVTIDGIQQYYTQPPALVNGRVMVPMRGIFEALGAQVRWDGANQTAIATKGDKQISLRIGSPTAYNWFTPIQLDQPALILNGSTMVPVRFVSEALGCAVEWIDATRTVAITTIPQSNVTSDALHQTSLRQMNPQDLVYSDSGAFISQAIITPNNFKDAKTFDDLYTAFTNTSVAKPYFEIAQVIFKADLMLKKDFLYQIYSDYSPDQYNCTVECNYFKRYVYSENEPLNEGYDTWNASRFPGEREDSPRDHVVEVKTDFSAAIEYIKTGEKTVLESRGSWKPFASESRYILGGATEMYPNCWNTPWGNIWTLYN